MKRIPPNSSCVRRSNDSKQLDQSPPYYDITTGCVTFNG